jgi:hypothetical protein
MAAIPHAVTAQTHFAGRALLPKIFLLGISELQRHMKNFLPVFVFQHADNKGFHF